MFLPPKSLEHVPGVDFTRHRGVLDHALLAGTRIGITGLGGAAGLVQSLTGAGIRSWTLNDYDRVSLTNPATQRHDYADRGKLKAANHEGEADDGGEQQAAEFMDKRLHLIFSAL